MSNFGDRFKKLRLEKGLTQEQLADEFNKIYGYSFSKSTISQYEKNKRTPEMTAIKRYVEYFNTSIDYLLCNDSYSIREKVNMYNNNISVKELELEEILNMINNMSLKDEIVINKKILSKEEVQIINDCIEIVIELVKKRRKRI